MQTDRVETIFDTNKNEHLSKALGQLILSTGGEMYCVTKRNCLTARVGNCMATFHVDAKIKINVTRIPNFTFSTKTMELDDSFYPPQVHITFENKFFNAREILN